MKKIARNLALLGVLVLVTSMGIAYLFNQAEILNAEFATYEDARKAKAIGSSRWLPDWLPSTATKIRETHSIDTNQIWLEFKVQSPSDFNPYKCNFVAISEKHLLPNINESLAFNKGIKGEVLLNAVGTQLYLCKSENGERWGVIWNPSRMEVLSWNEV